MCSRCRSWICASLLATPAVATPCVLQATQACLTKIGRAVSVAISGRVRGGGTQWSRDGTVAFQTEGGLELDTFSGSFLFFSSSPPRRQYVSALQPGRAVVATAPRCECCVCTGRGKIKGKTDVCESGTRQRREQGRARARGREKRKK